jgi:hypothetical protein
MTDNTKRGTDAAHDECYYCGAPPVWCRCDAAPTASAPSGEALTYSDYFVWITSQGKPPMSQATFDRLMAEEFPAPDRDSAIGQQADSGEQRQDFEAWMKKHAPRTNINRLPSGHYEADRVEEHWQDYLRRAALAQPVEVKGAAIYFQRLRASRDKAWIEVSQDLWDAAKAYPDQYEQRVLTDGAHLSATNSEAPAPQAAPANFTVLIDELLLSWFEPGNSPEKAERRVKARSALESAIAQRGAA